MKTKKLLTTTLTAALLTALSSTSYAEVLVVDVELTSEEKATPETAVRKSASVIYEVLNALPAEDRTEQQVNLLTTLDYLVNTAEIDDPEAITAINEISPKRSGTSAIVTRKMPATIPVKGIGKRLSALRKSAKRFTFLDSGKSLRHQSNYQKESLFGLMPGLVKYNTDPALESGGLLDQRLSGFVTSNVIISKQSDTANEAGFDGNTKQLTMGADYRINNKTFAGAAVGYVKGNVDISQGGDLDNTSKTLLFYATHSINQNWYTDATISTGARNFEMNRSVKFTLNNVIVDDISTSSPSGGFYGFSIGTGYDKSWNNGHNISLLASFNYSKSNIDAFKENGNSAYNLAVSKQDITSKIIDAGVEWRQAISTNFGVLLPQVSLKWTQELESKGDPINAYFIADPNNTNLSFATGNQDQGYMNLQLGVTAVLPRGLAAFFQYETQQFIDDYQQSMFSLGARKEF